MICVLLIFTRAKSGRLGAGVGGPVSISDERWKPVEASGSEQGSEGNE